MDYATLKVIWWALIGTLLAATAGAAAANEDQSTA